MRSKLIATLLTMMIGISAQAQVDGISEYFGDLEDDRSNTVITISGMMFKLFQDIDVEDEDDAEVLDAMSKLTGLKMLNVEDLNNGFSFYKDALRKLPNDTYEEWMTVREEDSDLSFLIRKKGDAVSELLMIVGSDDSFFVMSIVGDIDMSQISKISESMDIEGLDKLEKIDKNKN